MKRKLFFITLLMLLCSTMFGQNGMHWEAPAEGIYPSSMSLFSIIQIPGEDQARADLEMAAFHDGVCRGTAKSQIITIDGEEVSLVILTIHGEYNGEDIKFKLYVPDTNDPDGGKELVTDFVISFEAGGEPIGVSEPINIEYYESHWSSDVVYYQTMTVGCVININSVPYNGTDVELAAFCGTEVRGVAKPIYWEGPNIYYTSLIVGSNANANANAETISFKLYHPVYGELETDYTVLFANGATISDNGMPVSIDFKNNPAAQINRNGVYSYFSTLDAAVEEAQTGETIELLKDIEATEVILIDKSLTIVGNNKKVTSNATRVFHVTTSNTEVTLNDVNMVSTAVRVGTNDVRGISIDITDNVKLTLNNCSVDFTDDSANDWAYAVNVTGGNEHNVTVNGGTYEGANVINVRGASNTIVVKDATLNCTYPNNDIYGACIYVVQEQGSSVEATGNIFNGNNAVAFNIGTGTGLTESNNTDNTEYLVAKVGETYYSSLAEAFAAAQDGETIKVLHNIALSETIKNTKKVILDLNGKTITGTDNNTSGNFYLFDNRSELTVKGEGTITLTATTDRDWNSSSVVIANNPGGKLTIENGTIQHLGGTDMAYAIDNLTNGQGTYAETIINGGTMKSTYRAIRQFLNGIEAHNILTVNGGTIEGTNKSIWMQDPSAKANTGTLTVGEGAALKGDVYLSVTEGSTSWPVTVSIVASALQGTVMTANVPAGYEVKETNGVWGVEYGVAKIGETLYETLQAAVNAVTETNNTVKVLTDISLTEGVTVAEGKTVVLDLNGKTISRNTEAQSSTAAITNNGNLTIKDEVGGGKVTAFAANPDTQAIPYYASNTITNCGVLTVLGGTIENSTGDEARAAFPIDNNSTSRDAIVNIEGGKVTGRGAIRQFANSTTHKNEVNVKGGEVSGSSYAIWVQNPGSGDPKAALNIEGGELSKILMDPNANFEGSITGGTITEVAIWEADATNPDRNPSGFIKGGTFSTDVTEFCAEGFIAKVNTEGTYDVRFADYIVLPTGMDESNYETLFGTNTVTDGTNYYATMTAALQAVYGTETAILYCKPGANVGQMTHGAIKQTLTVYGNGAYTSGNGDFDIGNCNYQGNEITYDITLTVKYLDGCGAWGYKNTEHTVNIIFENCKDMSEVYLTGIAGATNITMNYCEFTDNVDGGNCKVYSNANGNITLTGMLFRNVDKAVNLNHKAAGTQTVTLENCTFTNCGNDVAADQIPVRVLSSVEGGSSELTVTSCTFTGTPAGGADILLDYGVGITTATVSETAANVVVEREANVVPEKTTTYADQTYTFDNRPYVAKVGEVLYKTIAEALAAVQDGGTITLINNVTEEFAIDNTTANITLDMAGFTLTGAITPSKAKLTIENGTINNENASYSAIEINAGTLVLNDVKVTSKRHGVRIDGAVEATINGGEYRLSATSGTRHAVNVSSGANVTITDGIFVGPKGTTMDSGSAVCVQTGAKVTIEGGDFSGGKNATLGVSGTMIVTGGTFDQDVTPYCAEGYLCELNDETGKYEVFRGLTGKGTETEPYLIKNLSDLVFFRDHVNEGGTKYNATGVWVALANDIDMTDIANWTPIGKVDYNDEYIPQGPVFVGVFNGNGKVISNLKVASTVGGVDAQANVGLFGITGEGAVIKDLTLTNVNIETDGRNVGALAGFAYKATLSNITVNGNIQIKGGNNVAGVAGMTRYYYMSATNISVSGANGSAIVGNNIVGGIFAEIAPNGSEQTFKNLSIENVAINGVGGVGGIVGLLTLGTVENVSVKNVVLTGRTDYQGNAMGRIRLGSVAGLMGGQCATIINPTVENVTAKNLDGNDVVLPIIGANYDAGSNATEARIGDTYYATLKHAIAAAQANQTVTVLQDITLEQTATIAAGKEVVLDLNGKIINAGWEDQSAGKHIYAFTNNGTLTIKDSSTEANGTINARGIFNYGAMTLENGTINAIDGNGGYAVRNYAGSLTMNGGTIATTLEDDHQVDEGGYDATPVRVDEGATFTMNGGVINNICDFTVAIDNHGTTIITDGKATTVHTTLANHGTMTINGGEFTCNGLEGITAHALWAADGTTTINGGTFNGKDNFNGFNVDASEEATVYITGGTFLPVHSGSLYGDGTIAVSGGTFFDAVPEARCDAGYIPTTTVIDGVTYYTVKLGQYVAKVGDVKYESLQDAVEAVSATDNEIIILANSTESVSVPADVIINLNEIVTEAYITAEGNLTFKGNGSIKTLKSTVGGTITVENGKTLALNNFSFGSSDNASATYTITGGTITANYGFFQHGVYALYSNFETGYMYYSYGSDITVHGIFHSEGKGDGLDYVRGKLTIADGGKSIHDKTLWVGQPASWGPMEATLIVEQGGYVQANSLSVYSGSALQIDATGLTGGETIDEVECNTLSVEGTVEAINNYKVMAVVEEYKIIIKAKPVMIVETDAYYATLAEAFAAANNQTVKVLQNITLTETVTIASDKTVTLDLAGYTVSMNYTENATANHTMISNNGDLTIKTSGDGGKISYKYSGANLGTTYSANAVTTNPGSKLTVLSGTIENTTFDNGIIAYAIDGLTNGGLGDVTVNINGGVITSLRQAVRIFANSTTKTGTLNISGSEITGRVIVQNANASANKAVLEITGGTFNANDYKPDVLYVGGSNSATIDIDASVSGGTFNGEITDTHVLGFITGGTFAIDPTEYCAENYSAVYDPATQTYSVVLSGGEQVRDLVAGWSWFSTYIDLEGEAGLDMLQAALGTNGVQIKGQEGFTQYYSGYNAWSPGLTSMSTAKMYMIKTNVDHEISLEGDFVAEDRPITLNKGWNWIGYPVRESVDLRNALKNITTPSAGDVIKSQTVTAIYSTLFGGWVFETGTDLIMTPGEGYMYYSESDESYTFTYSKGTGTPSRTASEPIEKHWNADATQYANNMSMIAMLSVDGEIVKGDYEIAAFANGECRGSARPVYIEAIDSYVLIMTISGEEVEELSFKYYDVNNGIEYELSNRVNYSNDAILGTAEEPYMLTLDITGVDEASMSEINIYPNPTTIGSEINLQAICDKVEVFNALGVKVAEYQNVDSIDALETAGIYVIRVTDNNEVKHCRLVVK